MACNDLLGATEHTSESLSFAAPGATGIAYLPPGEREDGNETECKEVPAVFWYG